MIGKTLHLRNFAALLRYVIRAGAISLGGNTLGQTIAELINEFEMLQALRPDLTKPVVHLIGAFSPDDQLSDAEMYEIAVQLLVAQGYEDSLFTVWRHLDGTTIHFHIVTCQIDVDGHAINQSFERYRMKRTCRRLEKEFGLVEVPNITTLDAEPPRPTPPLPEPDGLDIELPSVNTVVKEALGLAIRDSLTACKTFGDLAIALHEKGIAMVPQIHAENGQMYGLGFRVETGPLGGSYLAGSKISGNFSPAKLVSKHGLAFDPDRDLPILRNPSPSPPPSKPATPKAFKPRRKKKGERQHARRNRNNPRLYTGSEPTPWISSPTSLKAIALASGAPAGARMGQALLGHPGAWVAQSASSSGPLFPSYRTSQGWMAGNR